MYSIENPALGYTSCTQQALIDLNSSVTLRQELYNTYILTDSFQQDPLEELYHISKTALTTDTDSSTDSFDTPNDFRPLFDGGIVLGLTTSGLLFTDEYLHIENLFRERPVGLLFNNKDLNLNRLFSEPEPVGLLFADEDLHLN
ncbi:unnamed protein product [Rhizophagus irregularis]|nr:unnamed protein product [Rhizophagus irregularis]